MTPAQEAKEYATANGFTIEPVGRRYRIARAMIPTVTIAEVGGYPAALNAMKTQVSADDALKTDESIAWFERIEGSTIDELCAGDTLILPEPNEGPIATANDLTVYHNAVAPNFNDFDSAAQERIRKAAKVIRKQRSLIMTHQVVMHFSSGTHELAYPSYPAAIKGVRQVLSGMQKRYHPSFVTIQRIGA